MTATKYIAEFRHSDALRAGRIMALSGVVAVVTGTVGALTLVLLAPWLAENMLAAPHLVGELRIAALLLFLTALNEAQTGALSGLEAFRAIARFNILSGIAASNAHGEPA